MMIHSWHRSGTSAVVALLISLLGFNAALAEETKEADPCVGFHDHNKGYPLTREELAGDDEDSRYFRLSVPEHEGSLAERWLQELRVPDAASYLLEHVEHENAKVRTNAIYLLTAAGVDETQRQAIYRQHLQDPCRRVQAVAAMRLVEDGVISPEVMATLVRNFDDPWRDVGSKIQDLRQPSVGPIAEFIADSSQRIERRKKASQVFPYWMDGDNPDLKPLYEALDSEDVPTRMLAVEILLGFKPHDNRRIAEVLIERIESNAPDAADALSRLTMMYPEPPADVVNPVLLKLITTPGYALTQPACQALTIEPEDAELFAKLDQLVAQEIHADLIIEALRYERLPTELPPAIEHRVREMLVTEEDIPIASDILERNHPAGFEILLETSLNRQLPTAVRVRSILSLDNTTLSSSERKIADPQAIAHLAKLLDAPEPEIAQAAAIVLTEQGETTRDLTPLLMAEGSDPSDELFHNNAWRVVPRNRDHRDKLIAGVVRIAPQIKAANEEYDLRLFLLEFGECPEALDYLVDDILFHWQEKDFPSLISDEVSHGLIVRLEKEIAKRHGAEKLRIISALNNILNNKLRFDLNAKAIVAREPPRGLAECLDAANDSVRLAATILYSHYRPKDPEIVARLFEYGKAANADNSGIPIETQFLLEDCLLRAGPALEPHLAELIRLLDDPETRFFANRLLKHLGPKAKPATSKLSELLTAQDNESTWGDPYERFCSTLAAIGPDAISAAPAIVAASKGHRLEHPAQAIKALEADPTPLIQEFDRRLADPIKQYDALRELAVLAPHPAVTERYVAALSGDDWYLKKTALLELRRKDFQDAKQIVPLLIQAAKSSPFTMRKTAIEALGQQTGLPDQAVPVLMDRIRNDGDLRTEAIFSLGGYRADAAEAVPLLMQLLEEGEEDTTVITTLGRIGKPAEAAIPILIEYVTGERPIRQRFIYHRSPEAAFIEALGRFGPAAKAALPVLRSEYHASLRYEDKLPIAQAIYQISPGFGAVNGIPRPPEPEPDVLQFAW
ncbi:HEAT repeat domain-containing protein [Blastopirellula marina]|uniref:HEAT repeat domain-containing protein n=1 Tax=Blastopirellula marina TaxID=124 RepID=A0A2S8GBX7_9BACT|nr:HEAT repeat domain-containing protein [Blastopirellula marina]PQO41966.1 hypothetical protein C5Y93_26760 [Blastopirellula marina]